MMLLGVFHRISTSIQLSKWDEQDLHSESAAFSLHKILERIELYHEGGLKNLQRLTNSCVSHGTCDPLANLIKEFKDWLDINKGLKIEDF